MRMFPGFAYGRPEGEAAETPAAAEATKAEPAKDGAALDEMRRQMDEMRAQIDRLAQSKG
jgi:hypothetical protein